MAKTAKKRVVAKNMKTFAQWFGELKKHKKTHGHIHVLIIGLLE